MVLIEYICRNDLKPGFCESIKTSAYDQTYLRFMMWNNGKIKIIHEIYKLVFCHDKIQNCNLGLWSWLFTVIDV